MIDLSADLGEGAPREDEIWPMIDSANVACGGHAGDDRSMREAARRARETGVRFGAHPSYPDRANFGRRSMAIALPALRESLLEQLSRLRDIAASEGVPLIHVKPHGALYNDAHRDRDLAQTIAAAMRAVDPTLAIVCAASSQMAAAAGEAGIAVVREA
ncbi:MAG TPA: LamB/YcsF family protein, partial [Thermoanaerobaculia bacterium]|nr:LamB/YcsF family protein [Thermoanaerobaculia bacterium]